MVEKLLEIKFDSEPVYDDNSKYIKTKIKIYGGSVSKNFQGKGVSKEKAPCKCLSIIMLDSAVKAKKKHYPQTLLEEGKHEPKKIKMENLTDDDSEKKVHPMSQIMKLIMILMMKWNLTMIMMNIVNNLLKAKKIIINNNKKPNSLC